MQTAGTLLAGSMIGFLIIFILSVNALLTVFEWYPQFVAQQWFVYDQAVTAISFLGSMFGVLSTALIFLRRGSSLTVASALLCTICAASIVTVSLIQPQAILWETLVFFFTPLFIPSLVGSLIAYWRKEELNPKLWSR